MDLDSSTIKILGTQDRLEVTQPAHSNRLAKDRHNLTREIIGVIRPEAIRSILVEIDHLIDTRISLLTGMTSSTT